MESSSLKELKEMAAALQKLAERLVAIEKRTNRKKDFDKKKVTCYNCGKKGHFKREAHSLPKERKLRRAARPPVGST